jgi:hypothetical protein
MPNGIDPAFSREMAALCQTEAFHAEPLKVQQEFRTVVGACRNFEEVPPKWQEFILRMQGKT